MNYNIIDFINTVSSIMVDGFLSTIGKRWLRRSESQTQPLATLWAESTQLSEEAQGRRFEMDQVQQYFQKKYIRYLYHYPEVSGK